VGVGVQWIFLFGVWFNESLQLAYTCVRSVRVPKPSDICGSRFFFPSRWDLHAIWFTGGKSTIVLFILG